MNWVCGGCHQLRPHHARGICTRCYCRWYRAGKPAWIERLQLPRPSWEPPPRPSCRVCLKLIPPRGGGHGYCSPCYHHYLICRTCRRRLPFRPGTVLPKSIKGRCLTCYHRHWLRQRKRKLRREASR